MTCKSIAKTNQLVDSGLRSHDGSAFGVAHAVATDDTQYERLALCLSGLKEVYEERLPVSALCHRRKPEPGEAVLIPLFMRTTQPLENVHAAAHAKRRCSENAVTFNL